MNTYTYECKEHGDFEVKMPMSKHVNVQPCPVCGKESSQVHREAYIFQESFPGSFRASNPKPAKW